ncbi:MAG: ferrous iron transport protein A [Chloroflexi bacterium]|nr:ferrous iron transport protein A [Chloroflexota bacterium]MBP8058341.1 ferrous iron transport protein A [Chloroflexota bacterium]
MNHPLLTLDQLPHNQTAIVTNLTCEGPERRRLLDLGLTPGTQVVIEMGNPLGDPIAYLIRGSVIALRRDQAQHIQITVS